MATDLPATDLQATPTTASTAGGSRDGRTVLRECSSYAEAQKVVDALSDDGFAVENLTIVGEGLNSVEQVVGRLNWGKVLLQGVLGGGVNGVIIALLLSFFVRIDAPGLFGLLAYGFVIGAIIGLIFRSVAYAASGGKRDFQSVGSVQASRYVVLVTDEHAADATTRLSKAGV